MHSIAHGLRSSESDPGRHKSKKQRLNNISVQPRPGGTSYPCGDDNGNMILEQVFDNIVDDGNLCNFHLSDDHTPSPAGSRRGCLASRGGVGTLWAPCLGVLKDYGLVASHL